MNTNQLSPREAEVAQQVLLGKSNKQIALLLGISVRTVEFHLHNIFIKRSVRSRVELMLNLGVSPGAPQPAGPGESPAAAARELDDTGAMSAAIRPQTRFFGTLGCWRKELTMTAQQKTVIANSILWAAAIIAAALVGAPAMLSLTLLPGLAIASILITDARRKAADRAA